jgi:hypothetical protein
VSRRACMRRAANYALIGLLCEHFVDPIIPRAIRLASSFVPEEAGIEEEEVEMDELLDDHTFIEEQEEEDAMSPTSSAATSKTKEIDDRYMRRLLSFFL